MLPLLHIQVIRIARHKFILPDVPEVNSLFVLGCVIWGFSSMLNNFFAGIIFSIFCFFFSVSLCVSIELGTKYSWIILLNSFAAAYIGWRFIGPYFGRGIIRALSNAVTATCLLIFVVAVMTSCVKVFAVALNWRQFSVSRYFQSVADMSFEIFKLSIGFEMIGMLFLGAIISALVVEWIGHLE